MEIETFIKTIEDTQKNTRKFFKCEGYTVRTTLMAIAFGGGLLGVLIKLLQIIFLVLPWL